MTSADLGTDLAPLLEYTALAPDVTLEHVSRMCMEARVHGHLRQSALRGGRGTAAAGVTDFYLHRGR